MKDGILFIGLRKVVIGDLRAQMVDVMETDVPAEPLQDGRQFIKGTALQAGFEVIPLAVALPIHSLEIMLNIEQPYPRTCSKEDHQ